MDTSERNRIARLEREMIDIRRALLAVPARFASVPPGRVDLWIIDGKTVYSDPPTVYYGIGKATSEITSVGVQYDPNVSTTPGAFTAITGIGRAYLFTNNVMQLIPVLVLLDGVSQYPVDLFSGDWVQAGPPVTIDGPSAPLTVYRPLP